MHRSPFLRLLRGTSAEAQTGSDKLEALNARRIRYRNGEAVANVDGQGCGFVHSGLFIRMDRTGEGRQVICEMFLPGDVLGSCTALGVPTTGTLYAAGPGELAVAGQADVARARTAQPVVARALDFAANRRLRLALDHVKMLGALRATEKVRHLLADIWLRFRAVGLGMEDSFELPLTQTQISEVCGMSLVHTNKSIAKLRTDGHIVIEGSRVRFTDPETFVAESEIDLSLYSSYALDDTKQDQAQS